jgi:hypothetical protein
MINAEIHYQTQMGNNVKLGVEYRVVDQVFLRAGFNTNPSRNYFGIGFTPGRFAFDYAFSTHFDLGFAHQASACIKLGKQ